MALVALVLGACASGSASDVDDATDNAADNITDDADAPDATPGAADAQPGAADATPSSPDAQPLGPPDTCAAARDLTADARDAGGVTVTGDTTGYGNDTQPPNSCTGYTPDGPDAVYLVQAVAGEAIIATVEASGWDVSLFIASSCALDAACLVGTDVGGASESVQWIAASTGTYYVVVESWDPTSFGAYTLTVELG